MLGVKRVTLCFCVCFRLCWDLSFYNQPMDKEKANNMHPKASCPVPTRLPINWGLITGPVPEPVFPTPSLNTSLPPPPQSSAVHSLQTKVKSLTQRRTRGREREKDREKVEAEVQVSDPSGQMASDLFLRQRPRGKGQFFVPSNSWRSGSAKDLSSSDEEEEVEVQVRLEIHSPPVEAQKEKGVEENKEKKTEKNESQVSPTEKPCGLREGISLESLLLDNSSSGQDDPSPPTPPPELCSSPGPASSSSLVRHWAPPKGFWRVARPETLLLNGVGLHNIPQTLPVKDYTQIEAQAEPQRKSKPSEPGNRSQLESVVDATDASSQMEHSDSAEFYLDRCEQREEGVADSVKDLCSSDSWENMSPQSGVLRADLKLRVKERAYAKLRERQRNCKEKQDQPGGESVDLYENITYRVDYKGTSFNKNLLNLVSSVESLCYFINRTKDGCLLILMWLRCQFVYEEMDRISRTI